MEIALIALVTILVCSLTLVVGRIILGGSVEHALELKRLIRTIAHDMDFYANTFVQFKSEEQRAWRAKFRGHSCSLRERLAFITWYQIFEIIFRVPPKSAVREACDQLLGYSTGGSRTGLGAFTRRKNQRTTSHKQADRSEAFHPRSGSQKGSSLERAIA